MNQINQTTEPSEQLTKSQLHYRKYRAAILAAQKRYYQKNKEQKVVYQRGYRKWIKNQTDETYE